jgi:8-oxo-dGTP pyrophosphatase MutT (NUDIX family)
MPPEPRTEQFIMRVSPSELAMLRALAEEAGLAAADVLRTCIRREYKETFGDKPPKKTKQ